MSPANKPAFSSKSRGLAAIEPPAARLLILGSMPGQASLAQQQYYAHPRNQFWPIWSQLLSLPPELSYCERLAALHQRGILLWDLIAACERPGSLDQAIRPDSIELNDLAGLLARQPQLQAIAFNGQKAAQLFERRVLPSLAPPLPPRFRLPSTSPANAGQTFADKLQAWQVLLRFLAPSSPL